MGCSPAPATQPSGTKGVELNPASGVLYLVGEHNGNAQGNETGTTSIGEESVDPRDELTPG